MGKKSKKQQTGGTKAIAGAKSSASGGAVLGGGFGGVLTRTCGSKKQRCVECCALLKDLAKAHACPGCSALHCWRCEKKNFDSCQNGDSCVRPIAKCAKCMTGLTMERELVAAGALGPNEKLTITDDCPPLTRPMRRL